MPTLAGLRRRGFTPEAIRAFCERIGVSKRNSFVDVRSSSTRARGSERPLPARDGRAASAQGRASRTPEGRRRSFDAPYDPTSPSRRGSRKVTLTRELYIEREDFAEVPPKKWFRLAPGKEVRLRTRASSSASAS
jgi:glutaminyl-tRNA synthetase